MRYYACMSKPSPALFEIECPCCQATLQVDPDTRAVITFQAKEKAPVIEDLNAAVAKLKGESARREQVFQKSMADQKTHHEVLAKKFDELFKKAKDTPDEGPRIRDIDLD